MNKIILVGINARYTHSNLAIYYIKKFCEKYNSQIEIKEYTINSNQEKIIDDMITDKTEVLAFSVYIWNSIFIEKLIYKIKNDFPQIKIVVGGPEPSYNIEKWKNRVDFIVVGAGENGFKYLIENDFSTEKIINKPNPPFSKIPFPYNEEQIKNLHNKYFYYESSRGCPFSCSYCLSSRSDQNLQFKDIEIVKKELSTILQHEPKLVKFVDRTFNSKKDHYQEIWKFLIQNKTKTKFHFELYPSLLNYSDFEILKNIPKDLFQFEVGIQSTNLKTLKSINRNENWEKVKENTLKLLEIKNIHLHVDLIVGLPFEDLEKIIISFNEIYSLNADHFQMGFLKILPGTEISETKEKYEIIHKIEPPYEIIQNRWLNTTEILRLKSIENLLEIFYNSGKFKTTISEFIQLFNTPFGCYINLANFQQENEIILEKSSWEIQANLLLQYIEKKFPENKSFFIDCLRFDWCNFSKSHHYPSRLKSYFTAELKKECFIKIIKYSEKGIITFNDKKFNQETLRKSIFFEAESEQFKSQYQNKKTIWMFLPNKEIIFIT